MRRKELLVRIRKRRQELNITIESLTQISDIELKALTSFFVGDDVTLNTIEKLTKVLGLDLSGNEIINIQTLKEKRAEEKALQIVSLVQDTSSLEKQGLDEENIKILLEETKQQFLTGEFKNKLWKI